MAASVVKYSYNGTEYSFVTKDPAQLEDLKCPICLQLVYEPVLTSCGHLFCQKCVRGQKKCPTCRASLHYMRNQRDERKVKSLKVQCPSWEIGCEWQGDLGDIAEHIDSNCQVELIPCPKGCKVKIVRQHLKEHTASCTQRPYKCPHCWFEDSFKNVTSVHFTECKGFSLMCPAGCCNRHSRSKMAEHLAVCAEEFVPCKYASIGCQAVIKRRQLQTHLDEMKDVHLQMSTDMVMQLAMTVTDVWSYMQLGADKFPRLPFRPWLQNTPTCYPIPPWVIKMEGFQEKKENDEEWYSDPVYSHFGGYKMCVCLYANGHKEGRGTHVSLFICFMQGDNDDNLKWPFKGTIEVSLLNQLVDQQHYTQPWSLDDCVPEGIGGRVMNRQRAEKGFGDPYFICQQDLGYQSYESCQYLSNSTLYLRVDCFKPIANLA